MVAEEQQLADELFIPFDRFPSRELRAESADLSQNSLG